MGETVTNVSTSLGKYDSLFQEPKISSSGS